MVAVKSRSVERRGWVTEGGGRGGGGRDGGRRRDGPTDKREGLRGD